MQERLFNGINKDGFTMVELLVALTLSLIVLGAIYTTFRTQLYSFQIAEQTAPLQQNVRSAKTFLERDIRMAGANLNNVTYEDTRLYALTFDNDNAAGDAGTDKITIVYIDYVSSSCGAGAPSCDDLPSLTLKTSMPASSATAEIEEEIGDAPYTLWEGNCSCAGSTYGVPPNDRYRAIITSPDGTRSDVVFITQVSDNGASADNLGNGPYNGFDNKVLNTYPAGSTISFISETAYTEIEYDLVGGNLRRNGATIAENIEDLQFAFGLDTTGDGSVDSWINNADLTDAQKDQVRLVRATILGRSSREVFKTTPSTRPTIEDHAGSGTSDSFKRRQLELTVKVRNLGI